MGRKRSNRSKKQKSRLQSYRSESRKSWLKLFAKIAVFAVPVILLTIGLIQFVIPWGERVPLVYIGHDSVESQASKIPLFQLEHGDLVTDAETDNLKNLSKIKLGGLQKNTIFTFSRIVGTTRTVTDEDGNRTVEPVVFLDATEEEFQTHRFRGLLDPETTQQTSQWLSFESYIERIISKLPQSSSNGKVILALDVYHPEVPGGLAPQANSFIELCRRRWNRSTKDDSNDLEDETAEPSTDAPEVFVWFSHGPGQTNYIDSDPDKVGSFFKRRFELGLLGDQQGTEVNYDSLKSYLNKTVSSDARTHGLAQQPLFLEPRGFDASEDNFPLYRPSGAPELGTLFGYNRRTTDNELDDQWGRFGQVSQRHRWELENPLLFQRAMMILTQRERLWYHGHGKSKLAIDLKKELDEILDTRLTIHPVLHSIYDKQQDVMGTLRDESQQEFNLEWLQGLDFQANDSQAENAEQPSTLTAAQQKNKEALEKLKEWQTEQTDWQGALQVWKAIAKSDRLDQQTIQRAVESLSLEQRCATQRNQFSIPDWQNTFWSEIAYLSRLADPNELTWPNPSRGIDEARMVSRLVQQSIQARDSSNRFAAEVSPIVVNKFKSRFEELENRRRVLEDRLFAYDHENLIGDYERLISELSQLSKQHENLLSIIARLHQRLINTPYLFRYFLESSIVQNQVGPSPQSLEERQATIEEFLLQWNQLGAESVGVNLDREINRLREQIEAFELAGDALLTGATGSFATSPSRDQAAVLSISANVADGNLLRRRLMMWPRLDLEQRKIFRRELSDASSQVDASKDAAQNDEDPGNFKDYLTEFPQDRVFRSVFFESASSDSSKWNTDDERLFSRAAFEAHLLLTQRKDAAFDLILNHLNQRHADKSDLAFRRVAADVWATPKPDENETFVVASLRNHLNLIDERTDRFAQSAPWTENRSDWESRVEAVSQFAKKFSDIRFWKNDEQLRPLRLSNREISEFAKREYDEKNDFIISVAPNRGPSDSRNIGYGRFIADASEWSCDNIPDADSYRIYLRGHRVSPRIAKIPVGTPIVRTISLDAAPTFQGTRLSVNRLNTGIAGHLTFIIDCSGTMSIRASGGQTRMDLAKAAIKGFLEKIKDREDIQISLYAIGASFERTREELPNWVFDETQESFEDLIECRDNGKPVASGRFAEAIDDLKANRWTPILHGLKTALEAQSKDDRNVIVLLTDGCELTSENGRIRKSYYSGMLKEVSQLKEAKEAEIVEFNYLANAIEDNNGTLTPVNEVIEAEFRETLEAAKASVRGGTPEIDADFIGQRLVDIYSLCTVHRNGSENATEFLSGLLPDPTVVINSDTKILASYDLQSTTRELGRFTQPEAWSLAVRYTPKALSRASRKLARDGAKWQTQTRMMGNERLYFTYNPFLASLKLVTQPPVDERSEKIKTVQLDATENSVVESGNTELYRKPEFMLWAQQESVLTPAPELSFILLRGNGKQLLAQDFNLKGQTRSNVHPLEFPEITKELRREFGMKEGALSMTLFLTAEVPDGIWTRVNANPLAIRDGNPDEWKVANDAKISVGLEQGGAATPLIRRADNENGILAENDSTKGFDISLARKNVDDDFVEYVFRVESRDGKNQDLDRWLINVIDPRGGIDRSILENVSKTKRAISKRSYHFEDKPSGEKVLLAIEHHFRISKKALRTYPASFGIANLDQLDLERFQKVEYSQE